MDLKALLINPWCYDFSAVNLWSRPLGLIKVAEYLSQFNINIRYIDCMDIFKEKMFGTGKYPREIIEKPDILSSIPRYYKRYGHNIEFISKRIEENLPCDFILITSIMTYWYPGIQKIVKIIKSYTKTTPIILGGIYATICREHASTNINADYVFSGSIDDRLIKILSKFNILLDKDKPPKRYYELPLYEKHPFGILMTSKGCPFECSYCASKILSPSFTQYEPYEVIKDIKEMTKRGVIDFAFYDDALLFNSDNHIKIILKELLNENINVRFHCPNGLHARYIDDELAYLMRKNNFKTIRLSLETINDDRNKQTGGKVDVKTFVQAVNTLKKYGFSKEEVGAYLMYGLPGQSLEEVKEGIDFLKSLGIRINLTEFSPIPKTKIWMELKELGTINDNTDPLLTNNSIFYLLFSNYNIEEIEKIKLDVKNYNNNK